MTITNTAEARALAWARGILDDALEYPRAGEGWPHYSPDEATADAILRAAGLAHLLPADDAQTPEQRAERMQAEAAARAEAAELEAQRAAAAARYAAAEGARLEADRLSAWRLAWQQQARDLRDPRGVRIARVVRHNVAGRMSSAGGWATSSWEQARWEAEDGAPVVLPLVDAADSAQLTADLYPALPRGGAWLPDDAAPSDGEAGGLRDLGAGLHRLCGYIPARLESRARDYWDDSGAARIWADMLGDAPDALQAAQWQRRRAEKVAARRTASGATPRAADEVSSVSPFAALAALRTRQEPRA